jgi:hypothetical protein
MSYFEQTKLTDSTGSVINPANDLTIKDLYNQMGLFLDRLEYGMMTDNAKALQVGIKNGTVTTVSTVTTTSSLTNQVRIGDVQAQRVVEAQMDTAFIIGITNHITF